MVYEGDKAYLSTPCLGVLYLSPSASQEFSPSVARCFPDTLRGCHRPRPLPLNQKAYDSRTIPRGHAGLDGGLPIIASGYRLVKLPLSRAWRIQPRRLTGDPIEAQGTSRPHPRRPFS
jgi:hypothetical protein